MGISFIIPVYNAEKYIEDCVAAITALPLWDREIILVDDGSSDSSPDICDRLSREDKSIKVIHTENGGPSRARNTGLAAAGKEWIRFVDADDVTAGDWAESLEKTPPLGDWLTMEARVLSGRGKELRHIRVKKEGVFTPDALLDGMDSEKKALCLHYLWNHLYKKSIIEKYDLRFDEDISLGEDFLFNCGYLRHCSSVEQRAVNCYFYYKRNMDSLTVKFHPDELQRRRKMDRAYTELYKNFSVYGKNEDSIFRCIGEITVGALEAAAVKSSGCSFGKKLNYLSGFYNSEYYGYMLRYINAEKSPGKSQGLEFALIKAKSRLLFYWYVKAVNLVRRRKPA